MFFMSSELKKIMAMLASLESTELSHLSLLFFLHYYQCFHKSINKKIADDFGDRGHAMLLAYNAQW